MTSDHRKEIAEISNGFQSIIADLYAHGEIAMAVRIAPMATRLARLAREASDVAVVTAVDGSNVVRIGRSA
jgi:hypothetical protein